MTLTASEADRFWSKVDKTARGCWNWLRYTDKDGYGNFWLRKNRQAHIVAYEDRFGPVPIGLQLDHVCRNKSCVNPAHLEAVTSKVNTLRGESFAAVNAVKIKCVRGHQYTESNTYLYRGLRHCRACRKLLDTVRRKARSGHSASI